MAKNPKLFCWDKGQIGRMAGQPKPAGKTSVNVYYYPDGIKSLAKFGRPSVIRRVPASAVKGPYFPPDGPEEGIMVLVKGEMGESWLADTAGLTIARDIVRMEEEKARLRLENELKSDEIEDLRKGLKTELKLQREIKDTFEKEKRRSPFDGGRRFPPQEEY